MARFIIRSIISTIVTMLLVSILLFVLIEVGSGDISCQDSWRLFHPGAAGLLQRPVGPRCTAWQRYVDWLIGNDWRAYRRVGYPVVTAGQPPDRREGLVGRRRWSTDPLETGRGAPAGPEAPGGWFGQQPTS